MHADLLTRAEAAERAHLISGVSYDVELAVRGSDGTFASSTVVRFRCAEPGASTFLDLDARQVDALSVNGRPVALEAFDGSRIRLRDLAATNEVRVVARCAYQHTGVGLHRFTDPVDGNVYLHTQFEPFDAHRVYACFDQPDLKAPFTLTVDAPASWQVVSNAPVVEHADQPEGGGRWRFAPTLPISTYITAVVAGPYTVTRARHREVELGIYCRRSMAAYLDSDEIVELTRQGLEFYERLFAYPYPFGKYDQLFVPEFNFGAMENAGCVTFSENFVFRSKVTDASRQARASTILHEMAHMWFGDLVTMRWWDDLWLNESFATYMATFALAEATRFSNAWAWFANGTKAWAYHQDQLPSTHPIAADIVDTDAVRTNFDGITYAKGASVLRQLVAWVGNDAFIQGVRVYFRRHEFANATLADFLAVLEEASGRQLDRWSKQWLETAGVSTLRAQVDATDGHYRTVALAQTAPEAQPTLRAHRLALGLYEQGDGEGLTRRRRIELDVVGASTAVDELAGTPAADLLLVNDDDLTYAKVRLDRRSLETLRSALGRLREPLARALCWGAAWDMTRDAELPARRWIRLVADHAAAEREIGVLQTLLGRARSAADRYVDPAHRAEARTMLAERARAVLEAAEPGGDAQLVWARTLFGLADRVEDQRFVRGLLDGDIEQAGLAVDTELRWHIVTSLAAAGAAGEELIAAELRRDPTDLGARYAAAARAARPDAEAKRAGWRSALEDPTLPLATVRAVVGGFQQPGQEQFLRPYVDAYVEVLPQVWADRSPEEALTLTSGLYLSEIVDDTVVAAAERLLAGDRLPGPARRLVAEGRDATLRALRARAADRAAPE